jgi:hypothetical protein
VTKTQAATIASLSSQAATANAAIQSKEATALGPYVSVTNEALNGVRGPHIRFTGVNVHIRSGSGTTDDNISTGGVLAGLGNLFVGYDEQVPDNMNDPVGRTGSRNRLVGSQHAFQSYGCFAAGWRSSVLARWASVGGGLGNVASGEWASASGGQGNEASGTESSVGGGFQNVAAAGAPLCPGYESVRVRSW